MDRYDWKEVEPKMIGLWEEALLSLTSISRDCFNRRHQPCPSCGGVDRFRWTDNYANERGSSARDGGAICNQCGNGSGVTWLMKLSGMDFSTAVNELGRFVSAIPVERRELIKAENKSNCKASYGAEISADRVNSIISKCRLVDKMPYSLSMGIAPDPLYCFDKINKETGELIESRIAVPIYKINKFPAQGQEPELIPCNVAFIDDEGGISYAAGKSEQAKNGVCSRAGVSVIGKNSGKAIYLCRDWADSWSVHHFTGAQVWCSMGSDVSFVADKFIKERYSDKIRVACNVCYEDISRASDTECKIILPDGADTIREAKKFYKNIFDPNKIIGELFYEEVGNWGARK